MAKFEKFSVGAHTVRFDADSQTWLVLECLRDDGEGSRDWDIVDECDTEAKALASAELFRQNNSNFGTELM